MIRKLVMVLVLAALAGARSQAQQNQAQQNQAPQNQVPQDQSQQNQAPQDQTQPPPAQTPTTGQTPASQSSSSQEASDEDITRKKKVHDYKNWTYNVEAGANLARDTTKTFVKGGGALGGVGVARNFNKYFGFRLDFQYVNLPLRTSALQLAQAPSASSHVYALTLDPIVTVPVTKQYSGYFLVGPSFYHRSGKLDSSTAVPGSACNAFYDWWGPCFATSLPLSGDFLKESQNEHGYNFGGGAAKKVSKDREVFAEYRQQHGSHDNRTTDWRSVTLGLRW
jgi:opacity protein-like surface antigen